MFLVESVDKKRLEKGYILIATQSNASLTYFSTKLAEIFAKLRKMQSQFWH